MSEAGGDIRSKLRSSDDVLKRQLQDPEVRAEWERTGIARALALILVRYRREHGLSQTALGARVGMKQPAIARLERGDRPVTTETLFRILDELGVSFSLNYTPVNPTSDNGDNRPNVVERITLPRGGTVEIVAGPGVFPS